jgi:F-box protein 9
VSARHQPSSSSSSSSSSSTTAPLPTAKPKPNPKPSPLPSRRLSNPSTEDGARDEFVPEAPSLPIAHRRMSHSDSSSRETAAPKSALEHYERAAQKESEGNLGESLNLYRKAFRVCMFAQRGDQMGNKSLDY